MLSSCPSVPPPPITFEPVSRFHKIRQTGHAIKGDHNAILSNLVASRTFKLLGGCKNLTQST
jgi:hypothetical protein